MSDTEAFLSSFDPMPEGFRLPADISAAYAPDSCLAEREGQFVWRVRRLSDNELFVLKAAPLADRDLLEEYCILSRLSPLLPRQTPAPIDYLQENGKEYLLRTWLPGMTLAEYREREGSCSPEQCVRLGQKLCALLEAIHSQQPSVIHRDIKPENIVLLPDGEVSLVDFSIARQYKDGQATDTRHMGTRSTAAPEQYGYTQTDRRTDIYALGMTLIWLMTGSYSTESLAEVPNQSLRRALETAVSFAPKDRFQDAASFSDALAGHSRKQTPSRYKLILLLCFLSVVLAVGAGFLRRESGTVKFSSQVMEAAVRLELDRPSGSITYDDLAQITHLGAVGDRVFSAGEIFEYNEFNYRIGGVFYAIDGNTVHGDIADLSLLAYMPNLQELYLCRQAIRDISVLDGLPLVTLALNENNISDLSPLASLSELQALYVAGNPAADYGALAELANLRQLSLGGTEHQGGTANSLAFLEPLALQELILGRLKVLDGNWRPLASQISLDALEIYDPPVEAMEMVNTLSGLRELRFLDYAHRDLTMLPGLSELDSLVVKDLESLEGVQNLTGLRLLRLENCGVSDFSPLTGLDRLRSLLLHNLPNADYTTIPKESALAEIRADEAQMAAVDAACPGHTFLILPS